MEANCGRAPSSFVVEPEEPATRFARENSVVCSLSRVAGAVIATRGLFRSWGGGGTATAACARGGVAVFDGFTGLLRSAGRTVGDRAHPPQVAAQPRRPTTSGLAHRRAESKGGIAGDGHIFVAAPQEAASSPSAETHSNSHPPTNLPLNAVAKPFRTRTWAAHLVDITHAFPFSDFLLARRQRVDISRAFRVRFCRMQ